MLWLLPLGEQEKVRHTPYVTWTLVAINVVVFFAMLLSSTPFDELVTTYALTPSGYRWWQSITSAFMHAGPLHLVGNMLFLVVFGDNVEDILGPLGFLLLYVVGGLAGDYIMVAYNPGMDIPSLGASGCIATIAGAYALMFFNRAVDMKVILFVFPVATFSVPALFLLFYFFGVDLAMTAWGGGELPNHGGVNYVAHGVGFGLGLLAGGFAFASGAVGRFRRHPQGHALFGYLPWNLGRRTHWRG
jgi:membrane associated rhomboid family serine protease